MSTRREFITLLGGAAAWPPAAQAQQPERMRRIGFLNGQSASNWRSRIEGFDHGLREGGYVGGHNVAIEYRWAEGKLDRLPVLAAELVARRVDVLVATGGSQPALVAQAVTASTPIVFVTGIDPVELGLVKSLGRPEGNATGLTLVTGLLGPKRLHLLSEMMPSAGVVAVLINPDNHVTDGATRELRDAALALGKRVHLVGARSESEFEPAFDALAAAGAGALLVSTDPFLTANAAKLTVLAARRRIPAIYEAREFVDIGGLMSSGQTLRTSTGARVSSQPASSRAPSPPTSPSSNRPSSSW
jgi:putative ABC transport system substrate-binding protein